MVVTTRIAILSKYRENRRQIPLLETLGPSPCFELGERNVLAKRALREKIIDERRSKPIQ